VERTEKLDDYALAGIVGYWIVNPFDRQVEIYRLRGGEYELSRSASTGIISLEDFPGVAIDLRQLWEG
jgi:Uma2 family endonuclease